LKKGLDKEEDYAIKNTEQLLQITKQSLSINADKNVRKTTKTKILIALKEMHSMERNAAVEGVFNMLSETEDPCLQNYLADILLLQRSQEVNNRLMQIIMYSNGKIADFVKIYVTGVLNGRGYENIYRR